MRLLIACFYFIIFVTASYPTIVVLSLLFYMCVALVVITAKRGHCAIFYFLFLFLLFSLFLFLLLLFYFILTAFAAPSLAIYYIFVIFFIFL